MAEKLCTLRTKGGGGGAKQVETVLWTNSNPTSSSGWTPQTITLSGNKSDYDYIKFIFAFNYNNPSSTINVVYPVSELSKFNDYTRGVSCAYTSANGRFFYRVVNNGNADNTIGLMNCYQQETNNTWSINNLMLIPISIVGIKDMGGKVFNPLTYVYESVTITSGYTETIPSGKTKDEVVAICINFALSGTVYTAVLENVNGTLVKVAGTLNVSMTFPTDTTIGIAVDNYNKAYAIDWIFK